MRIRKTDQFLEWESTLADIRAQAHVQARIRRLGLGNPGDVRPVGEGVSEMRIHYGPGYRVYYRQTACELVILLVGGDKRSQKADIALAKALAKEL